MTMTLADIIIYPLKAGAGLSVERIEVTPLGLMDDRRWMLVQEGGKHHGRFISQRSPGCGKLALIKAVAQRNGSIVFNGPGQSSLTIDPDALLARADSVQVWGTACAALDAGEAAATWFSNFLGLPCRLVRMDENVPRPTDPKYSQPGDRVSFADGMPLLVTSTASLEALNQRLGTERVNMDRFRPNLVLDGTLPFEEDAIHSLKIGEIEFELVLPCARCAVPNIDQHTGIAHDSEPSKTLIDTRRGQTDDLHGVFFGQNAIPRSFGTISLTDSVEVLARREVHPALKETALGYREP